MGKSAASCFKIIACGSDSVDNGDLQSPESKVSSSRSGWSFRKQSARHRVLTSTIISEAPSCTDKESPEFTAGNLLLHPNLTVPEKASMIQCAEEKDPLPAHVDSNMSNIIAAEEDATPDESSVILIQAAIRGHLTRKMHLKKKKEIIKLQAAVRGHLVRKRDKGNILDQSNIQYELKDSKSAAGSPETYEMSSSTVYPGAESSSDNVLASAGPPSKSGEIGLTDASISNAVAVQTAGSECGTELSITSTLDTPDMSDGGVYDLELEPKVLDPTNHPRSRGSLSCEAFPNSSLLGTELSYPNMDHLEKNPESDQTNTQEVEPGYASPTSHPTVPESLATPSSQASLTPNKSKKTPLKQAKTGKRRSSLSSIKLDHPEEEPRGSTSSRSSLPSYMLPTESAKAKSLSSGSPVASPDVHDKDVSIKNRQESSPRIYHSQSTAQHNGKGNGTHSPQDRKWRR